MSPDEIRAVRKATGWTQKDLAAAFEIDVTVVRDWEKGEQFPTKAHCDQMARWEANPPPRKKKPNPNDPRSPMAVLTDPQFFELVRKLLGHAALRAEVEKLAAQYPDPAESP